VTAPVEAEDALMRKGKLSVVGRAMEEKTSTGVSGATVKEAFWVAEAKFPLAAWVAERVTEPAPVRERVEPERVAGPETTA
jgi:hypothetical protein